MSNRAPLWDSDAEDEPESSTDSTQVNKTNSAPKVEKLVEASDVKKVNDVPK